MNILRSLFLVGIVVMLAILVTSCKKDQEVTLPGVPSFVSKEIIDDFRQKGLIVNEGVNPPQLNGTYLVSPNTLLVPYGPEDSYDIGKVFNDYRYKFYAQTKNNEIKYDYKSTGTASGTGAGSFISGEGNKFTIYSEVVGTTNEIDLKTVTILTGEISTNGIKNWQEAFIVTFKGADPEDKLIDVGQGRILYDGDAITESVSGLRLNSENLKTIGGDESIFSKK